MFNNIKIGTRVAIGFFLVLAIFIGVSIYSIYHLRVLADHAERLYNHPLIVGNTVREIEAHLINMHRNMKDVILSTSPLEQNIAIDDVNKSEEKIINLTQILSERFLGDPNDVRNFRELFYKWRPIRGEVIRENNAGNKNKVISLHKEVVGPLVIDMEQNLYRIKNFSNKKAKEFLDSLHEEEREANLYIMVSLLIAIILSLFIILLISNSIKNPLKTAVEASDRLALGDVSVTLGKITKDETGQLFNSMQNMVEHLKGLTYAANTIAGGDLSVDINPRSEQDKLGLSMQIMASNLRKNREISENQNWLKEGINQLSQTLFGNKSPVEICFESINFLCRYVDAGLGVIYLWDKNEQNLKLSSSFALTEMGDLAKQYALGAGVIGQVAQDKKPILQKNISKKERVISTGTSQEAPLHTYTYPLLLENNLLGIIELASNLPFTEIKQVFFEQANTVIASALQASIQNQKIKDLLEVSEKQTFKLQETNSLLEEQQQQLQQQAEELQITNSQLEEQQQQLQQHAEELQMTNSQLEEQQQQTQQQAEELQMNNSHLEEQQQQLQQQAEELRVKNEDMIKIGQRLAQANKYKSEFLANMSHELRTPLNSIILLSKLLSLNQNSAIGEKEIEKIEVIHHAGNELLLLINDLLDLAKIEAGKVTIFKTIFNTSDIIEENKNMFRHIAAEKGFDFILEDRLQKSIYTDKGKLSQILRNFLANSFKFTKKGFVRLLIEKNPDPLYPVKFSVDDSGIGIPKDKLEIIFEAFTQVDGTLSREYNGTGLGLFISQGLAQVIGGKIEVQSEEGKGTTITLFLKTDISEDKKGSSGEERTEIQKTETIKSGSVTFSNKKILIVDDDIKNIFLMKNALEDLGAELYEAQNGKEALELMDKQKFDLVLMDIMMPVMDGYQTMKLIRAKEKFRDVSIIAITAKALKEDYIKCIEAGADDYLTKPIDYDNMMNLLTSWINRNDPSIQNS